MIALLMLLLAANTDVAPAFPKGTPLMPARKVDLILDANHHVELDFPKRPSVLDELVNLLPGEKINVEAEVQGNKLVHLKYVETVVHPERTITLEFGQTQDRNAPMMMLTVTNPFKKHLAYSAGIQRYGKQDFFKTSVVGVGAGLVTFESWPYPLTRIMLRDFLLTDEQP